MTISLEVEPHPLLDLVAFETTFPRSLGELGAQASLVAMMSPTAAAPLASDDAVRGAVRDLLRHGGYKPTGRGKPASEYLVRAAGEGALSSINAAVDACNAVSLHSGLPISVVDLDRARAPYSVRLGRAGEKYVFNASGQEIDIAGLLCFCDADGPSANAVKDAQRTKTHTETTHTLTLIWGACALTGRAEATFSWYRELLEAVGASIHRVI